MNSGQWTVPGRGLPAPSLFILPPLSIIHYPLSIIKPPAIRPPTSFDFARLVSVSMLWGASFVFIEIALRHLGPLSLAAWRLLIGYLALLLIVLWRREKLAVRRGEWVLIALVGLLNSALPFSLISWGQQFTNSAKAALLMATASFFALLVSHWTTADERINRARVIGLGIGFFGVCLLFIDDLQGGDQLSGQLAIIAAACSYATAAVCARRLTHLPPIALTSATLACGCVILWPLALWFEQPLAPVDLPGLFAVLYLGGIATALCFVIRFTIIRANGAVFMSQVGYLIPLFGVLLSQLILGQAITWQIAGALVMVLAGIGITRLGSRG